MIFTSNDGNFHLAIFYVRAVYFFVVIYRPKIFTRGKFEDAEMHTIRIVFKRT